MNEPNEEPIVNDDKKHLPKKPIAMDSNGCLLFLIFIALMVCASSLEGIATAINHLTDAVQKLAH